MGKEPEGKSSTETANLAQEDDRSDQANVAVVQSQQTQEAEGHIWSSKEEVGRLLQSLWDNRKLPEAAGILQACGESALSMAESKKPEAQLYMGEVPRTETSLSTSTAANPTAQQSQAVCTMILALRRSEYH